MRWVIFLVVIMMGSIAGCSEKQEVEQASTESKNKNEVSKLVGNWHNDDWYFTLKKQNENLVMSLEDDGKYWDLTLEVQNVKKDRVEAIVVNSSSQSQERSIGSKVIFKLKGDGDLEEIIESPSGVQQVMEFTKTAESRSTWAEQKKKREATREELSGK